MATVVVSKKDNFLIIDTDGTTSPKPPNIAHIVPDFSKNGVTLIDLARSVKHPEIPFTDFFKDDGTTNCPDQGAVENYLFTELIIG